MISLTVSDVNFKLKTHLPGRRSGVVQVFGSSSCHERCHKSDRDYNPELSLRLSRGFPHRLGIPTNADRIRQQPVHEDLLVPVHQLLFFALLYCIFEGEMDRNACQVQSHFRLAAGRMQPRRLSHGTFHSARNHHGWKANYQCNHRDGCSVCD